MARSDIRSDLFPPYQATTLPDGKLFVRSMGKMVVPEGGAHVRQIEFRFPHLESDAVITAMVVPVTSVGPSFVIYSVTVEDIKGGQTGMQTKIIVSAQSVTGAPMRRRKLRDLEIKPIQVQCSIMVTGTAVDRPARKPQPKRRTRK